MKHTINIISPVAPLLIELNGNNSAIVARLSHNWPKITCCTSLVDLGVQAGDACSPFTQWLESTNEASDCQAKKLLPFFSKSASIPLHQAVVSRHLGYGVAACLTNLMADANYPEGFWKLVTSYRYLPFEERLLQRRIQILENHGKLQFCRHFSPFDHGGSPEYEKIWKRYLEIW